MQKIMRRILFCIALASAVILLIIGIRECLPEYDRLNERTQKRAELQAEVDTTRQKIAEINRNIERFQESPHFVERLARENQRVTENEVIFVLEE